MRALEGRKAAKVVSDWHYRDMRVIGMREFCKTDTAFRPGAERVATSVGWAPALVTSPSDTVRIQDVTNDYSGRDSTELV